MAISTYTRACMAAGFGNQAAANEIAALLDGTVGVLFTFGAGLTVSSGATSVQALACTTFAPSGTVTLTDVDVALSATTGTKIGTATSQKLGFFNATPIVQVGATIDLGVVLSNLGLRAAGTAYTITTSGAVGLSGTVTLTDNNIALTANTGTKIGTATTQKLGFWNATPVVQYSTTGTVTGYTSVGGSAVLSQSTFTGNSGSTAYTIGDLVLALKTAGFIAA